VDREGLAKQTLQGEPDLIELLPVSMLHHGGSPPIPKSQADQAPRPTFQNLAGGGLTRRGRANSQLALGPTARACFLEPSAARRDDVVATLDRDTLTNRGHVERGALRAPALSALVGTSASAFGVLVRLKKGKRDIKILINKIKQNKASTRLTVGSPPGACASSRSSGAVHPPCWAHRSKGRLHQLTLRPPRRQARHKPALSKAQTG
jgi:hypothetical protein